METKTVKGIVEAINPQFNSVKIGGVNYSGKYTYKGLLPNVGDEVEIKTVSEVSKKDGKTYWNLTDVVVIKSCPQEKAMQTDKEKSIIAQCLTKIVFGEKGGDPQAVFDCYMNFLGKL